MKTFHPTFHAANIWSSPRLQRALSVLQQAGNLTGWEWCEQAGIMNPGGVASELAQNGYDIEARYMGKNQSGRKVWRYIYYGTEKKTINCCNCGHGKTEHKLEDRIECIAFIYAGGFKEKMCDCTEFKEEGEE